MGDGPQAGLLLTVHRNGASGVHTHELLSQVGRLGTRRRRQGGSASSRKQQRPDLDGSGVLCVLGKLRWSQPLPGKCEVGRENWGLDSGGLPTLSRKRDLEAVMPLLTARRPALVVHEPHVFDRECGVSFFLMISARLSNLRSTATRIGM